MSERPRATEIVFLPGFDGMAEPRAPFVAALAVHHPARAVGYPNRAMRTLNGYVRHAAATLTQQSRPVLVAESFSGLVAARWAASDPHVAGLVLCGAFARAPMPWAALGAAMPSMARFVAAYLLAPPGLASRDPARRRWSEALSKALRDLDRDVIAERLHLIATEDVSVELAGLRIPVVIVQFEEDVVIGSAARAHLESTCAGARVLRVPGPHFAIETRPLESAAAIRAELAALFA